MNDDSNYPSGVNMEEHGVYDMPSDQPLWLPFIEVRNGVEHWYWVDYDNNEDTVEHLRTLLKAKGMGERFFFTQLPQTEEDVMELVEDMPAWNTLCPGRLEFIDSDEQLSNLALGGLCKFITAPKK